MPTDFKDTSVEVVVVVQPLSSEETQLMKPMKELRTQQIISFMRVRQPVDRISVSSTQQTWIGWTQLSHLATEAISKDLL